MPIDRQATLARLETYCTARNLTPPPVDFGCNGHENVALFALYDREGISLDWLFRGDMRRATHLMAAG